MDNLDRYLDDDHDLDEDRSYEDLDNPEESAIGVMGCLFPGQCCMPGEHFTSECHTAQMLDEVLLPEAQTAREIVDQWTTEHGIALDPAARDGLARRIAEALEERSR